jgi:chaperonin GroES
MSTTVAKPVLNRVLIKQDEVETKTKGGIIIPDTAKEKEKPRIGTVIAVGPGKKDEPMSIEVGDRIIYDEYGGTPITIENEEYVVLRENDILVVLNN